MKRRATSTLKLLGTSVALLSLAFTTGCSSHCASPKAALPRIGITPIIEQDPLPIEGQVLRLFKVGTGPPVIVLHEITGLSPDTFRLARLLADAGFAVYLPLLFGEPGDSKQVANGARACIGGPFHCFHKTESTDARLIKILLALSRRVSAENSGAPVGVIGMCLTGNTGLELVREGAPVRAVVASQPALPFLRPAALGVSEATLQRVKAQRVHVLALRFSSDTRASRQRLLRLKTELGDLFQAYEIDSGPLNSFGFKHSAHAVLTTELVDEPNHPTRIALDKVIQLFKRELR